MKFHLRRRRTVPDVLVTLLLVLLAFGLSWHNAARFPMAIPERYFLIGWTVLFICLIAMELASALRRSVALNGEAIVIRSGLRPACTLPIAEVSSVTLARDARGKKAPAAPSLWVRPPQRRGQPDPHLPGRQALSARSGIPSEIPGRGCVPSGGSQIIRRVSAL